VAQAFYGLDAFLSPNKQHQTTEKLKALVPTRKIITHPLFIHYRTPERMGTALFMTAV